MVVDDVIKKETGYTPPDQQKKQQQNTVSDSLDPFLNAEKGDVEFWIQVLQLVVLYLILKEVRG